jgi:tetratricopeptide (TPR) repeat protein
MSEFNRFEEYKLFVEDTARLSDRRQTISNIYVTVNSILLAAIGLIIKDLGANGCWLLILPFPLVIAGIAVCIWWHQLILKYKRLIGLRMDTLRITEDDPEMKSAIKMYHKEDKIYERDSKGKVLEGPVSEDSPLFQLFTDFPGIEISHELTDVFRDRVKYSMEFREKLRAARSHSSMEQALSEIKAIEKELGDLKVVEKGIIVDLLLSYRDVSAWDEMVALYDRIPADVRGAVLVRQQHALALNRRAGSGDRERAISMLEALLQERGSSAETYGILGRVYKDQYKEAKQAKKRIADGYLEKAIDAYTKGFECEPVDYYPGVNAITLLLQKGTEDAIERAEKLTPLVSFAVARRGGASSSDYWDLATVLELALIGRDEKMAMSVLAKVLVNAKAAWMVKTTVDNLDMLKDLRKDKEDTTTLSEIVAELRKREDELKGKN